MAAIWHLASKCFKIFRKSLRFFNCCHPRETLTRTARRLPVAFKCSYVNCTDSQPELKPPNFKNDLTDGGILLGFVPWPRIHLRTSIYIYIKYTSMESYGIHGHESQVIFTTRPRFCWDFYDDWTSFFAMNHSREEILLRHTLPCVGSMLHRCVILNPVTTWNCPSWCYSQKLVPVEVGVNVFVKPSLMSFLCTASSCFFRAR